MYANFLSKLGLLAATAKSSIFCPFLCNLALFYIFRNNSWMSFANIAIISGTKELSAQTIKKSVCKGSFYGLFWYHLKKVEEDCIVWHYKSIYSLTLQNCRICYIGVHRKYSLTFHFTSIRTGKAGHGPLYLNLS